MHGRHGLAPGGLPRRPPSIVVPVAVDGNRFRPEGRPRRGSGPVERDGDIGRRWGHPWIADPRTVPGSARGGGHRAGPDHGPDRAGPGPSVGFRSCFSAEPSPDRADLAPPDPIGRPESPRPGPARSRPGLTRPDRRLAPGRTRRSILDAKPVKGPSLARSPSSRHHPESRISENLAQRRFDSLSTALYNKASWQPLHKPAPWRAGCRGSRMRRSSHETAPTTGLPR